MGAATHTTYCRICSGICGLDVEVTDGTVTGVAGDVEHPLSRGYTCTKGRHIGDLHARPDRFLSCQRRGTSGTLEAVGTDAALDAVAQRLRAIVDEHGPDAVAMFRGTQATTGSLTFPLTVAWWKALGSTRLFTTMTIDQSAKWVTARRLGAWEAGRQRFEDADVWLLAGTNPLVSLQGGDLTGFPVHNPSRSLRDARRRGLTLIVVDPRRTETAAQADLHLQLVPGSDAVLYAAMLHTLLAEDRHDVEFCAAHVSDLDALRAAVAPVGPDVAAPVTGLDADEIRRAARLFAAGRRGMAMSGTGVDMGPASNVAEHLLTCLNVVCGRFPRAGEPHAHPSVLRPPAPGRAQVAGPDREWERGPRGRLGHGRLFGELPSATLPDEILHDGDDRIRALVCVGANPASCLPDQARAAEALGALDLLVAIEPFPTETTAFADYVLAPALALERPDFTRPYEAYFDRPFAQYTPAVLPRPDGILEDWEILFELSGRLGLPLRLAGETYEPGAARPSSDELIDRICAHARVPVDEVRRHPHGAVFESLSPAPVEPAEDGAGRFETMASDVAAELADAVAVQATASDGMRLVVRRVKATMNGVGRGGHWPGAQRTNPCLLHPDDLVQQGIAPGDVVEVSSAHGTVRAVAGEDRTLRRGVASLTHGFGGPSAEPDDPEERGANPSRLISATQDLQSINAMPVMTAIPVSIRRA